MADWAVVMLEKPLKEHVEMKDNNINNIQFSTINIALYYVLMGSPFI